MKYTFSSYYLDCPMIKGRVFDVFEPEQITKDVALFAESEDGEVVSINDGIATLQGTGTVSFRIFKNGGQHVETVDFTGGGLRKIII